jgi:hypothetical protein
MFRQAIGIAPAAPRKEKKTEPEPIVFEKIFRVDGRTVSIAARVATADDAVLVLLLGQHEVRNNRLVSGHELMNGLRTSGHDVLRIDQTLTRHLRDGYVQIRGRGRRRRYQLTPNGTARAEQIARSVKLDDLKLSQGALQSGVS